MKFRTRHNRIPKLFFRNMILTINIHINIQESNKNLSSKKKYFGWDAEVEKV